MSYDLSNGILVVGTENPVISPFFHVYDRIPNISPSDTFHYKTYLTVSNVSHLNYPTHSKKHKSHITNLLNEYEYHLIHPPDVHI